MDVTLHALQDDWTLNALADTDRSEAGVYVFSSQLTNGTSSFLTRENGDRLVITVTQTVSAQILHSIADDFTLNG